MVLEYRSADDEIERFPRLARELIDVALVPWRTLVRGGNALFHNRLLFGVKGALLCPPRQRAGCDPERTFPGNMTFSYCPT
jgi:hypothetical protein